MHAYTHAGIPTYMNIFMHTRTHTPLTHSLTHNKHYIHFAHRSSRRPPLFQRVSLTSMTPRPQSRLPRPRPRPDHSKWRLPGRRQRAATPPGIRLGRSRQGQGQGRNLGRGCRRLLQILSPIPLAAVGCWVGLRVRVRARRQSRSRICWIVTCWRRSTPRRRRWLECRRCRIATGWA